MMMDSTRYCNHQVYRVHGNHPGDKVTPKFQQLHLWPALDHLCQLEQYPLLFWGLYIYLRVYIVVLYIVDHTLLILNHIGILSSHLTSIISTDPMSLGKVHHLHL